MKTEKYNILLFLTDQLRAKVLGCYGNTIIHTPNIDSIASDGIRFDRAYVQNPVCMPSRATILTGLYPRVHGLWTNGVPFNTQIETMPGFLSKRGYSTASIGKIHLNPHGPCSEPYHWESMSYWEEHPDLNDWHGPYVGFDYVEIVIGHVDPMGGHYKHYLLETFPRGIELSKKENALDAFPDTLSTWKNALPAEYHYNRWIAEKTRIYLREHMNEPFFLVSSFPDPHFPFSAPAPYCNMYNPADLPAPLALEGETHTQPPHFKDMIALYATGQDEKNFREMAAQTYGMVNLVDECIGTILEELENLGLREKTIVVFTADHGELLGDHGLIYKGPYLYQPLVNVPLVISMPAERGKLIGSTNDSGLMKPGTSEHTYVSDALIGHIDLFPTLLDAIGEDIPHRLQGQSFLSILRGEKEFTRRTILTEFHDLYYDEGIDIPFNLKCIHHDRWKLVHYGYRVCGELYDLQDDPDEYHNLYNEPSYRNTVKELEAILIDELLKTEGELPLRITSS